MTLADKLKQDAVRKENQAIYEAQVAAEEAAMDARVAAEVEKKKKETGITDSEELAHTLMREMTEKFSREL